MRLYELLGKIIATLDGLRIPYLVAGSVAAVYALCRALMAALSSAVLITEVAVFPELVVA